jgi:transcriptional regulator with XRE-family HTH domain
VRQTKRSGAVRPTSGQGPSADRQGPAPIDPETGPATRRFSPRRKRVPEGGSVFGALVANERAKLGLTQRDLATMIRTSPSTVARIEEGHPPSAELRQQLVVALNSKPPGPLRRAVTRVSPRGRLRRPRISLGSRWLWGGVAVVNILIALILGGRLSGDSTSASPLEPAVAVSDVIGAPAAIHKARVLARKQAAAEARRAAELKREREAAAAAAAAAAAKKAAAKADHQSTLAASQPATAPPVTSSPAPSSSSGSSGGGGGGSSGPAPGLQHGIGAGGG